MLAPGDILCLKRDITLWRRSGGRSQNLKGTSSAGMASSGSVVMVVSNVYQDGFQWVMVVTSNNSFGWLDQPQLVISATNLQNEATK